MPKKGFSHFWISDFPYHRVDEVMMEIDAHHGRRTQQYHRAGLTFDINLPEQCRPFKSDVTNQHQGDVVVQHVLAQVRGSMLVDFYSRGEHQVLQGMKNL